MNSFERSLRKYYTPEQFKKIRSAVIGIGGAGGLGSNVATTLARCGFINFEILDFDKIDPSNLNRQQYNFKEIGKDKVKTLRSKLLKINPNIRVKTFNTKWSKENAKKYFKNCDIVTECFDKPEIKRDLVEYYQDKVKWIVSGNGLSNPFSNGSIKRKIVGNILVIGDNLTDITINRIPITTNVIICSGIIADVILDLTLKGKYAA